MWNERYSETDRIWSGKPNARLSRGGVRACHRAARWTSAAARAATRGGWRTRAGTSSPSTSPTPPWPRAAADAGELAARIDFQRHDLTQTFPDGTYDLVSAQFLHSPVPWERDRLLRRAAEAVAAGGTLFIVDHGEAPPWSNMAKHVHDFPSAQEVVDGLALDLTQWEVVRAEAATRDAIGPTAKPVTCWTMSSCCGVTADPSRRGRVGPSPCARPVARGHRRVLVGEEHPLTGVTARAIARAADGQSSRP